jgi:hypothetical protein
MLRRTAGQQALKASRKLFEQYHDPRPEWNTGPPGLPHPAARHALADTRTIGYPAYGFFPFFRQRPDL